MVGPESPDFRLRLVLSTSCGENLRGFDPDEIFSMGLEMVGLEDNEPGTISPGD